MLQILFNTICQLAQYAGQSIQQWLSSPQGQQFINYIIQTCGPTALQELYKMIKDYGKK